MNPYFKYFFLPLIFAVLVILSTLYVVHPRTIVQTVPATLPDSLAVNFPIAKPDTTYKIKYDELLKKYAALRVKKNKVQHDTIEVFAANDTAEDTLPAIDVYETTFNDTLASMTIQSKVTSYALGTVLGTENTIAATINKKWMSNKIDEMTKPARRDAMRKGVYIGAGSAVVVVGIISLIAK